MSTRAFPITSFGGLRLDLEPDEVGPSEALDALNVDLDRRGAVRTRDGYAKLTASAATDRITALLPFTKANGTKLLFAGRTGAGTIGHPSTVDIYDTTGTIVLSDGGYLGSLENWSFARIGTAAAEYVYAVGWTSLTASPYITRYDGTVFTSAGVPNPAYFLAVQSPDNRLVLGYYGNGSKVAFSDPGDPNTVGANSYVLLTPGDGERITNLVAFKDSVIAFKSSRYFTFYGNSTDADGEPIFNYRRVDAGVGCAAPRGVAVSPQGVYFLDRRGIYVTRGGEPTLVSGALDPLFRGSASAFFASSVLNQAQIAKCALTYHDERLFFAFPSGSSTTNDRLAVYDPHTDQWLLWNVAATCLSTFEISSAPELVFGYPTGANEIGRMRFDGSAYTDDAGTAIISRYRSGFYAPLEIPSQECTVRESIIEGIGTPSFSLSRDYGAVPTTGGGAKATVTLGTSPAYAQGRHRVAQRGRRFSYQIEATSGAWRVDSITQRLTRFREPGLKTT